MTRIVILGGPRTGKTTAAERVAGDMFGCGVDDFAVRHSDDLIEELKHLGKDAWSEGSRRVSEWLDAPGPWIIEGVALSRALRKWREAHPGEPPPVDKVIRLTTPHVALSSRQVGMAQGEEHVWQEIEQWLLSAPGVAVEEHGGSSSHVVA